MRGSGRVDGRPAGNLGDLMVGGAGADRLVGGNGNDFLISALLVDGANNEDDGYTDLVNILTTGAIPAPLHVVDDGAVDKLTGGGGTDTAYVKIFNPDGDRNNLGASFAVPVPGPNGSSGDITTVYGY